MATTYLNKTLGTPTNNKIWTFSAWVKRSRVNYGNYPNIFCANSLRDCIRFLNGDNIQVFFNEAGSGNLETRAKFRDVNAWYHIVVAVDTTQATSSNRVKIYVNGEQITSFATETYPAQNYTNFINSAIEHRIGKDFNYTEYFDGYMSHIHFIDGTQYQASDFGETDSTTGEWKIKTSPTGINYGNNGFFILKDSNSVTDQSGNSNNWTVAAGTLTNSEDCPSNVFCTMNPLSLTSGIELKFGNTRVRKDTSGNSHSLGTIAFGNGKYYFEGYRHGGGNDGIGVCRASVDGSSDTSTTAGRVLYYEDGTIFCEGLSDQSNISTGITYGDTDIISVSFDTENGILKFYKNDTLVTNSTITNSSFTNANDIWVPHTYQTNGGEWRLNFGNGYFGTTAVSSAGTNASGNGIFEYDVPTGFTALSTKGLNL